MSTEQFRPLQESVDSPSQSHEDVEASVLLQHPSFLLHDLILAAKLDNVSALRVLQSSIQEPELHETTTKKVRRRRMGGRLRSRKLLPARSAFPSLAPHIGDLEDSEGWTPLHSACENRSEAAVVFLVSAGCSPNQPASNHYNGVTPMHMACLGGHIGILNVLIAAGGTLLSPATTTGLIPIDMASCTSFPSVELVNIIDTHSGIRIGYGRVDDLAFGPQLSSRSFYCLKYDKPTDTYSVSSDSELRESVFRIGQPELSSSKTTIEAAHAVVTFALPPVTNTEQQCLPGHKETEVDLPCDLDSQVSGLSDSFSDLLASRELYMTRSDRAHKMLDSLPSALKDFNRLPGEEEEVSVEGISPSDAIEADTTLLDKSSMPPPSPKAAVHLKQARFAPGTESPVSGLNRRKPVSKARQIDRASRRPLSDITPPQPTTPTGSVTCNKPPTPYPIRGKKESLLQSLEGLQLDTKAPNDKENKLASAATLEFSSRLRSKGGKYRRVL